MVAAISYRRHGLFKPLSAVDEVAFRNLFPALHVLLPETAHCERVAARASGGRLSAAIRGFEPWAF